VPNTRRVSSEPLINESSSYFQSNETIGINGANLQRTGLFQAKGVHVLNGIIWKSPKLFSIEEKTRPFQDEDEGELAGILGLHYFVSPPIFSNGMIFFSVYNGDGFLAAFDAKTGERRWLFTRERGMLSPPIVVDQTVYVGAGQRTVVSLDANSGREVGRFSRERPAKQGIFNAMRGDRYSPMPIVSNNLVLLGGTEGNITAIDTKLTELKWTLPLRGGTGPAAIANNTAFFGTTLGLMYAIDLATGKEKWKINAQVVWPMVSDNLVFFGEKGTLHAIDAGTGQEKWKAKVPTKIGTALASAYEAIYFGGIDGDVYAVHALDGKPKWQFKTKSPCDAPVVSDGVVYASCEEHLFAIDAKSGMVIWDFEVKKSTMRSPVILDDLLCVVTADGFLFALR
jgi:outer membrane protein assembly factor BamB